MLSKMKNRTRKRDRAIREAGTIEAKKLGLHCAQDEAEQDIERIDGLLASEKKRREQEDILHRHDIEHTSVLPWLGSRYATRAKALTTYVVGGLGLESVVSAALNTRMFWYWPAWLAALVGFVLALLIASIAHGLFVVAFSTRNQPLTDVRRLQVAVTVSSIVALALLIPIIMARVVAVPPLLADWCLGLESIVILLAVGSAAALRVELRVFHALTIKIEELENTRRFLNSKVKQWHDRAQGLPAEVEEDIRKPA